MKQRTVLLLWVFMLAFGSLLAQQKVTSPSSAPVSKTDVHRFADTARFLEKRTELGLLFGQIHYLGDLSNDQNFRIRSFQPMGGLLLRRYLFPNLALRGNLLFGKMSESDQNNEDRKTRNIYFETAVTELSLQAEWHIFGKKRFRRVDSVVYELDRYRQIALVNRFKSTLSPYLFGGGGGIVAKPNTVFDLMASEAGGTLPKVKNDQLLGGAAKTRLGVVVGGGINVDLGRNWLLGAELGARTAFSDYFDGVSQTGNPAQNDWYWFGGMTLSRRLGTKDYDGDGVPDAVDRCPKIPGRGITQGCPDADGDRIADREDECPHKFGALSMGGCPMKGINYDSIADVEYRFAAGLIPAEKTVLFHFADSARFLEKSFEIGLIAGPVQYLGDLSSDAPLGIREPQPMGGIFLRRHLTPVFALRANVLLGSMRENDLNNKSRAMRNFSFENPFQEISLQAEWDIWGKQRFRRVDTLSYRLDKFQQRSVVNTFRRAVSPYLFAGGGAILTNVKTNYDLTVAEQSGLLDEVAQDRATGTGKKTNWGVLVGAGLTYDLSQRWVLGGELGARTALNDYFDGVSQSGNPKKDDWYWFGGLTLSRRIGKSDRDGDGVADAKDRCPGIPGPGNTQGCPDADGDRIADRDDQCPQRWGVASLLGCPLPDLDKDSIPDAEDACPDIAGPLLTKGCPDTDGDGVEDRADSCRTVAGLLAFMGCPDTDGDGVADAKDACPTEKGEMEYYKGCPAKDSDSDGVEDKLDGCPNVAGPLAFQGCPDTDGDGIEDSKDDCPNGAGKAEFKGCPDSDGDGIGDNADECPSSPGPLTFKGCPDTDGDGLADPYDYCPDLAGPMDNKGCPHITKKEKEKLEIAVEAVQFETGKAKLKPESNKILTDIAGILKKYKGYHLRVEGHTDNVGGDKTNQTLSEKRANACVDFLVKKGVARELLLPAGFGETKPVADNNSNEGRSKNRRVEFLVFLPEKK